ncbi:hypothetical protein DFP73DRAFT_298409 [Morchella snyderi]|nr:hypothetical protein DFP73DRAFT_298409 [Morchella snyderi]
MMVEAKDPAVMLLQEELVVFFLVCAIIHAGSGGAKIPECWNIISLYHIYLYSSFFSFVEKFLSLFFTIRGNVEYNDY